MLYDHFGRPLNSLRIQVNASCNFKCFFCHMEGTDENAVTLSPEEIERAVMVAAKNGVNRVKFTGGGTSAEKGPRRDHCKNEEAHRGGYISDDQRLLPETANQGAKGCRPEQDQHFHAFNRG